MKLDSMQIKSMCMMVDLGEFKREEIAKQFRISKSHLDKLYRLNNTGNDTFREKNILDTDEVRLVNETLMQENEELRNENKKLADISEKLFKENEDLKKQTEEKNKIIEHYDNKWIKESEMKHAPDNVKMFIRKCKTMQEIYAEKNTKYGNSFTKTYQEYGNPVLCIRLEDKLSRIKQLLLHNVEGSADESVIDSLTDLGNYAIMAVMELEKK